MILFPVVLHQPILYDLQAAVEGALRVGARRLELPRGVHRVSASGDYALDLKEVKDLEITGVGTTLLVSRPDQGFAVFRRCSGIRLTGFTVRHETPSMTQGWIRTVSADKGTYEVEIMPGYLHEASTLPDSLVGYVFEPAGLKWRKGSTDLDFAKRTFLGNRRLKLEVGHPIDHQVQVGDYMAFRGEGRQNILFDECSRTRVDGLTIQSSPGFAIHEGGGDGGSFFRYRVLRGPKPLGASVVPLLSSNADAFHSSGVRRGPVVEGCRFEWMADDGIPIHGNYVGVAAASRRRLVVTAQWPGEWFRPGDRLRIYEQGGRSLRTRGELPRVVSFQAMTDFQALESSYPPLRGKRHHYEVILDRDVPDMAIDDLAANVDAQGNGYVVRGNTIRNHRARGMLLTADDGLVENNVVDGSTIAGIVLCPEMYWMQSDYSHNVTIRNNTVRNVSHATVGPGSHQIGGIVVTAELAPGATQSRHHQGIRIENNLLETIFGPAIVIRHATGVVEKNNRFRDLRTVVNNAGRDQGYPASGERFVQDADVRP